MRNNLKISPKLFEVIQYFMPRILFMNSSDAAKLHWGDLVRALHGFPEKKLNLGDDQFWYEWMLRFSRLGDEYYKLSSQASVKSVKRAYINSCCAAYHWAEFMFFSDSDLKIDFRKKIKKYFWENYDGENEFIHTSIKFNNTKVPIHIGVPRKLKNEVLPCIILSNGLDSVTEIEMMSFASLMLQAGFTVVLFDGPGQGVNLGTSPLLIEVELLVDRIINALIDYPFINLERLGFFGVSFGGVLALRVAQHLGEKFKFIVNYSGGPVINPLSCLKRKLKDDFQYALQNFSDLGVQNIFDKVVHDFESFKKSTPSILSIHGDNDDIFPVDGLKKLDCQLNDKHELIIFNNSAHVCLNYLYEASLIIVEKFNKML